jgi:dihydrofolate reductase
MIQVFTGSKKCHKRSIKMRKIVVGMFVSLDGVIEGPGPTDNFEHAGWTMPYFNEEVGQAIAENTFRSDALLLGRQTYHDFAAVFASQSGGQADIMNNFPKYVVSTTLKKAEWTNSTLISKNVVEEITKLKQQPGKDITISGSGTLVHSLMAHGLIDEYSLLVMPVVLGTGKRLFPNGVNTSLELIGAKPLSSGVVHLSYVSKSNRESSA